MSKERKGVAAIPDRHRKTAFYGCVDREAQWVLVLDDDAEDAFAVFRMLERLRLQATLVADGPAALDRLDAEDYASRSSMGIPRQRRRDTG